MYVFSPSRDHDPMTSSSPKSDVSSLVYAGMTTLTTWTCSNTSGSQRCGSVNQKQVSLANALEKF